jgi:serine protease Do
MSSEQTGAMVEDVVLGSAAADRGITAGSVIINVQRVPIVSPADVMLRFREAQQEKRASVLVLMQDRQGRHWIVLPLPQTETTR